MFHGFWKLVWVEIKVFAREPLGLVGTVAIPVLVFIVIGRALGPRTNRAGGPSNFLGQELPIFAALFIAIGAVLSLVAIISIYREGGILKRLRATPLRPLTILGAHVFVKLVFTALTLILFLLAGRRFYPVDLDVNAVSFTAALLITSLMIFSIGFVIASMVPTARFSQPLGTVILYPMLAISGIFVPLASFPPTLRVIGEVLPMSHAVSLLRGTWAGASWFDHAGDLAVLSLYFVLFSAVAAKVFRWE